MGRLPRDVEPYGETIKQILWCESHQEAWIGQAHCNESIKTGWIEEDAKSLRYGGIQKEQERNP
jgi:hypothetical protein